MDIRAEVTGFRGAEPLPGLPDSWRWSPVPGIDFAGALSADGKRLLQLSGRNSYDQDLAVSTLRFARDHEDALFARNPFLGSLGGFEPPAGHRFDAVVGIAPEVHRFYRVENPDLTPHVRLTFPAYACEFSGDETLDEAITRYRMLRLNHLDREPLPFLKMRYANTRTRGRSTNQGRGLAEPTRLVEELRLLDGGTGSFVEFENRHGDVWRAEWHGAWFVAEWNTQNGMPREIGLDGLVEFAIARLTV
ncbi:hypothetical protein PV396_34150 [Streptomyces sp. ME02-8801-2C]|uniref:hypothetical protein n=1 Tax=Streptomyces sp. ME02-8801-2C TaxID=3028680 RepID=UPI0029AAB0ED|nr:hypothetical protein [Streptomyces sp. ME02-8801-2C]MDX3456936.1 hypothetical protein [Streptomyces sp. ME02-8801-2C]